MDGDVNFVVRRFDDLGRIVIPKEIRKELGLVGEKVYNFPMKIYVQDNKVVLEKWEGDE